MQCGGFVLAWGLNFSSGRFGALTLTQLLGYKADFEPGLSKLGSGSEAAVGWVSQVCCDQFVLIGAALQRGRGIRIANRLLQLR